MKHLFALLALALLSCSALADLPPPRTEKFKLGDWEDDIGYRQAVRVGRTLYVSGSVGSGAMPAAIKEAYDGLKQTLAHYGLNFSHVVKETIYTTDLEALKANRKERRQYYGNDLPAATWVQVSRLYDSAHVIEVEIVAEFPE